MHKATKAALISAFIFPGCGHFYLKSKLRGAIFTLFSVGCLYALITYVVNIANDISDRILSGDVPLNISSLMTEISSQLNTSASDSAHIASLLLLSGWGIAIIDTIIVGRRLVAANKINKQRR
jgi:hypothetical protein